MKKSMVQHFASRDEAMERMRLRNRAAKLAGNREVIAVVAGPDAGWSVVDLRTAIELGCGYTWEVA